MKTINKFLILFEVFFVLVPAVLFEVITFILLSVQTIVLNSIGKNSYSILILWLLWFGGCLGVKSLLAMIRIISFSEIKNQDKLYTFLSGVSGIAAILTAIIYGLYLADTNPNPDRNYYALISAIPIYVFLHWYILISSNEKYVFGKAEKISKDQYEINRNSKLLNLTSLLFSLIIISYNVNYFFGSVLFSMLFMLSVYLKLKTPAFYFSILTFIFAVSDVQHNNAFYGVYVLWLIIPIFDITSYYLKFRMGEKSKSISGSIDDITKGLTGSRSKI